MAIIRDSSRWVDDIDPDPGDDFGGDDLVVMDSPDPWKLAAL